MPTLKTTVSYDLAFNSAIPIPGTWARPRGVELVHSPEKLLESETSFVP